MTTPVHRCKRKAKLVLRGPRYFTARSCSGYTRFTDSPAIVEPPSKLPSSPEPHQTMVDVSRPRSWSSSGQDRGIPEMHAPVGVVGATSSLSWTKLPKLFDDWGKFIWRIWWMFWKCIFLVFFWFFIKKFVGFVQVLYLEKLSKYLYIILIYFVILIVIIIISVFINNN